MWTYNYTPELYHHGIIGQRWGVRRFQNPDGSLTAAGRKRYGTVEALEAHQKAKSEKKQAKEKKREAKALQKRQAEWDDNVQKNWWKAYNKACDYFAENIEDKINSKWSDEDIKANRDKYEKEVNSFFDKYYEIEFNKMFGKRPE